MPEQLDLFGPGGSTPPLRQASSISDRGAAVGYDEAVDAHTVAAADEVSAAGAGVDALIRSSTLDALAGLASSCRRCGLRSGCNGVVFGEGRPDARIMLVGEGPGASEDQVGRPFVGRAGQLLDRILEAAGFTREDVYITNVVLCRPPGNRVPTGEEMALCRPYLERRLELVRPRICVALGSTAAQALIHTGIRITQVRGQWHRLGDIWIMPTYHPAALLRDPNKKRPVWDDFRQVRDLHGRLSVRDGSAGET